MKSQLLKASENEISDVLKETIREWDEEVTFLQILKTLDFGVHSGSCSSFVVKVLELLLDSAIKKENTTYDLVVEKASWRK